MGLRILKLTVAVILLLPGAARAQTGGRLDGRVIGVGGASVGGVVVMIQGTSAAQVTDNGGRFAFANVTPGEYTLTFTLGDNSVAEEGVVVSADLTTTVELNVDWSIGFAETLTIYSASRRLERIVEAPAAVTVITEKQIERLAPSGQLPKLLEFTPGAEVTQSGLYDFNFNTRGFNSSLNRRVAVLIDGRDPSLPFLGAQEWAAISFPMDDISTLELIRGPSAALYGANASSGVLNMLTKQPRYSKGGMVRLTGGEPSTFNIDLRWAGALTPTLFFKINAGQRSTGDYSVSRMGAAEYSVPCDSAAGIVTDCLPQEAVPLARSNDNEIYFGGLRLDKYFNRGGVLTVEAGTASVRGPLFQTGIGRVQVVDVERPWARTNFSTEHWNVLLYHNRRDAPEQLALASGSNLALDSKQTHMEIQTHWDFVDGDLRLVAGASYEDEELDSLDKLTGRQSVLFAPVEAQHQAVFAQLDWRIHDDLKLVVAGRWDDSDLHDPQFNPKGSLVYSLTPTQTLRFSYNEAFQVANYSELFLQADVAAPEDLSGIEAAFCTPFDVDCGFGSPTRVLALGNKDLEIEEVTTLELGYNALIGGKTYLTVEYYNSDNKNFITDLLPRQGTALGQINPNFDLYVPPADHPDPKALVGALTTALGASYAILSNNLDGTPILGAVSYTNFGQVDTQGVDIGWSHYVTSEWKVSLNYSWFDFEIQDELSGFDSLLLPNSPEHKASGGFVYDTNRWDFFANFRWVDDFRWGVGPFQGDVESYTLLELGGDVSLSDHWSLGFNIANALDNEHWESFGGDLLERRALVNTRYRWK